MDCNNAKEQLYKWVLESDCFELSTEKMILLYVI